MELYKELNFVKAKSEYEESIRKDNIEWQKQINEIKTRQALKNYNNFAKAFAKAIKEI